MIVTPLPLRDFLELYEAFEERAGTISTMKLAETGFRERMAEEAVNSGVSFEVRRMLLNRGEYLGELFKAEGEASCRTV